MQSKSRNELVDALRGIVILYMILMHFSSYCPSSAARLISYLDFAMEGFLFLAGFCVGKRYWTEYLQDEKSASKGLVRRALKIYALQVFMVLTLSLPLHLAAHGGTGFREPVLDFTLKSLAMVNQVGLIHILPTFIPMFLISPLILYAFKRNQDGLILAGSVILFAIGNVWPYLLDIYDKTIFPFILWQAFYVAGFYLAVRKGAMLRRILTGRYCLVGAVIFFSVMMALKHLKIVLPVYISKFPLNALGLLYGASILWLVYAAARYLQPILSGPVPIVQPIERLGRHSLLVFVIHVYTAKMIGFAATLIAVGYMIPLAIGSLVFIYLIVFLVERRKGLAPARFVYFKNPVPDG